MLTAALVEPDLLSSSFAMSPASCFPLSSICMMSSSRVSRGVRPGRVSYFFPSFPNFSRARVTSSCALALAALMPATASSERSSSSIPVVNPSEVQAAMDNRVNSSKKRAPCSEPLVWTMASRRRPSSAPMARLSRVPSTCPSFTITMSLERLRNRKWMLLGMMSDTISWPR